MLSGSCALDLYHDAASATASATGAPSIQLSRSVAPLPFIKLAQTTVFRSNQTRLVERLAQPLAVLIPPGAMAAFGQSLGSSSLDFKNSRTNFVAASLVAFFSLELTS
jgi:hypothetical protein